MQLLPTTQHLLHSWNLGESYDWSLSFPLESIYHLNDNSFFLNSSNCFWYRNLEGPLFPVSFWQDVSCRLNRKDEAAGKLFYKHRGTCKSARLLRWNFDRIFQLQRCFTAHGQSCWTKPSCHWSHLLTSLKSTFSPKCTSGLVWLQSGLGRIHRNTSCNPLLSLNRTPSTQMPHIASLQIRGATN